jgi:pyroglutamyl-peptidase
VILVTGFEPFGGAARNPAGEAALALDGRAIGAQALRGVVLPCIFAEAPRALRAAIRRHRPELVLSLGLAASRRGFHLERVAVNLIDARIADNAGAQPVDRPVAAGGPAAAFTTLPVKAMAAALQAAGHEAQVSYSAGSFVCNQVFYALMRCRVPRAGFLHVGGDLAVPAIVDGVRIALAAALGRTEDLATSAGRVD